MMRHLVVATVMAAAATAAAQTGRLDYTRPAAGVSRVVVEAGVGEVEVVGDGDTAVTATVELEKLEVRFWGSRHGEDSLSEARIEARLDADTLRLKVRRDPGGERSFGETWRIRLPKGMAVKVDLGVGEVKVLDVAASVTVDIGVGDVRVDGEDAAFGVVRASSGVGDATIRTPDGEQDGDGLISHSLSARRPGKATLRISTGVGSSEIRLR